MAVPPLPDNYQREGGYLAVTKPEDLEFETCICFQVGCPLTLVTPCYVCSPAFTLSSQPLIPIHSLHASTSHAEHGGTQAVLCSLGAEECSKEQEAVVDEHRQLQGHRSGQQPGGRCHNQRGGWYMEIL